MEHNQSTVYDMFQRNGAGLGSLCLAFFRISHRIRSSEKTLLQSYVMEFAQHHQNCMTKYFFSLDLMTNYF